MSNASLNNNNIRIGINGFSTIGKQVRKYSTNGVQLTSRTETVQLNAEHGTIICFDTVIPPNDVYKFTVSNNKCTQNALVQVSLFSDGSTDGLVIQAFNSFNGAFSVQVANVGPLPMNGQYGFRFNIIHFE